MTRPDRANHLSRISDKLRVATLAIVLASGSLLSGPLCMAQLTNTLPDIAGNLPRNPSAPANGKLDSKPNLSLKPISPGVFELGKARLDNKQRTVSFPAVLNLNEGPLEYLLVTGIGKTHESLLRTDVDPTEIHVAMLLLGARAASTNQLAAAPPKQITNPFQNALPGDPVSIEVSWTMEGKEVRRPARELLIDRESKSPAEKEPWVYNGSSVWEGKFLAKRDGSIIALVNDSTALINNTGQGRNDDEAWTPATNSLPPLNAPVTVTLKLLGDPPNK